MKDALAVACGKKGGAKMQKKKCKKMKNKCISKADSGGV